MSKAEQGIVKLVTLDIDYPDLAALNTALKAISKCPRVRISQIERSVHGNWHVGIWCEGGCYRCRDRFDDPARWSRDKNRPAYGQNVLFSKKQYIKLGKMIQ